MKMECARLHATKILRLFYFQCNPANQSGLHTSNELGESNTTSNRRRTDTQQQQSEGIGDATVRNRGSIPRQEAQTRQPHQDQDHMRPATGVT